MKVIKELKGYKKVGTRTHKRLRVQVFFNPTTKNWAIMHSGTTARQIQFFRSISQLNYGKPFKTEYVWV